MCTQSLEHPKTIQMSIQSLSGGCGFFKDQLQAKSHDAGTYRRYQCACLRLFLSLTLLAHVPITQDRGQCLPMCASYGQVHHHRPTKGRKEGRHCCLWVRASRVDPTCLRRDDRHQRLLASRESPNSGMHDRYPLAPVSHGDPTDRRKGGQHQLLQV